jgi:hypothetical protein
MPARAYDRSHAQGERTSAQNFSVSPKKPILRLLATPVGRRDHDPCLEQGMKQMRIS